MLSHLKKTKQEENRFGRCVPDQNFPKRKDRFIHRQSRSCYVALLFSDTYCTLAIPRQEYHDEEEEYIRLPPLANFLGCTASENVSSKNAVMTLCRLFATIHHWTIVIWFPAFFVLFSSAIWRASSSNDREHETTCEKKKGERWKKHFLL